jgi:hypothetical protein
MRKSLLGRAGVFGQSGRGAGRSAIPAGVLTTNSNFESLFFAKQARVQREVWVQAVSADLALPGTREDHSPALRLFNWYRQCVLLAARNPAVGRTFSEVQNLLSPVSAF